MNILKQLLLKFLSKEIEEINKKQYDNGCHVGAQMAVKDRQEMLTSTKIKIMELDIGENVIYCSNEWEDPVFAVIEGLERFNNTDLPMYKARNVLNDETVYFFNGSVYLADEKMVDAILKLDPFERWNMNLAKGYLAPHMWSKQYPPTRNVTDPVILKQRLKEVNFI